MGSYQDTTAGLLHWVDYGGDGPPIVLVHGLGGSTANWDAIGPRLHDLGHVVALDLPGFGLSPPAPNWELETHATALTAFIEWLGTPVALVGNSFGALISEMVAASRPDLVENLVLIAPATPPRLRDDRIHWPTAIRLMIQATPLFGRLFSAYLWARYGPEELVRLSLSSITYRPSRVPVDLIDEFVRMARIRAHLPWTVESVPATANAIVRLWRNQSRFVSMIRDIVAPTLVVQGHGDRIVSPTAVEWLCSLRPDWELVQLEETGHTPQLDAPMRLLGVITPWLETRLQRQITA